MTGRFCVIGAGRMGAVHARRLTQTSTVDSVVVADVVVDRAERLAASLNCEAVPVERLIASRPTGVIIAAGTPTWSTCAWPTASRASARSRSPRTGSQTSGRHTQTA